MSFRIYSELFHVQEVRIPKFEEGKPTLFVIEIIPFSSWGEDAEPWVARHRFREFHELLKQLGDQCHFSDAPFPERSPYMTGARLDARRAALELWLNRVVQHPLAQDAWARLLRDFLSPNGDATEDCVAEEHRVEAAVDSAAPSPSSSADQAGDSLQVRREQILTDQSPIAEIAADPLPTNTSKEEPLQMAPRSTGDVVLDVETQKPSTDTQNSSNEDGSLEPPLTSVEAFLEDSAQPPPISVDTFLR